MQRYLYKIYAEYTLLSQYQANSHTTKHPRNRILRLRGVPFPLFRQGLLLAGGRLAHYGSCPLERGVEVELLG